MSFVLAVLNPKGGSGKSTLSTNIARGLQLRKRSVLLIDADAQGTARDWRETAGDTHDTPPVFGIDRPTLDKDIPKIGHAFDIIVIDGAAKTAPMTVSAVKAADLVLIPVQPSAADLWAASDLVDILKARREVTDGKPDVAFVVSRQIPGTRLASGIEEILTQYGLPILKARTSQRVAYVEALAKGLSVLDVPLPSAASLEIIDLLDEIETLLPNPPPSHKVKTNAQTFESTRKRFQASQAAIPAA